MTNDFIDRGAERLGELVVVEGRWIGVILNDVVVNNLIDSICCDSCLDGSMSSIESPSGDDGYFSHFLDVFGRLDLVLLLPLGLLLFFG